MIVGGVVDGHAPRSVMAYSPARTLPASVEDAGSAACRCRGDER